MIYENFKMIINIFLVMLCFFVTQSYAESVRIQLDPVNQLQDDNWSCGVQSSYRVLKGGYGQNVDYVQMRSTVTPWDPFRVVLVPRIIEFSLDADLVRVGQSPDALASSLHNNFRNTATAGIISTDQIKDLLWLGIPVVGLIQVGANGLGHIEGCAGTQISGYCFGVGYKIDANYPLLHYIAINGYDDNYIYFYNTDDNVQYVSSFDQFEEKRNWTLGPYNSDIGQLLAARGVKPNGIVYFNEPVASEKIRRVGDRYPPLYVSSDWGTTVTSSDGKINCGSTCSNTFKIGTPVTLTVSGLAPDATVTGWDGPCQGGGASCTVTMNQASTVRAKINCPSCVATLMSAVNQLLLDDNLHSLSVSLNGTGSGSVSSVDGRINCGSTCSANIDSDSSIDLVAVPNKGNQFSGWSGGCNGTQPICTIKADSDKNVVAGFTQTQQTKHVTVAITGTGAGTVTSAPSGISCPGTCSADFTAGTQLTFTAQAASGAKLTVWSGACSGNSMTCTTLADYAGTVGAQFDTSRNASLSTTCPSGIDEASTATCTVTAKNADGTAATVKPTWASSNHKALLVSPSGELAAGAVAADTPVTISATADIQGARLNATSAVLVKNQPQGSYKAFTAYNDPVLNTWFYFDGAGWSSWPQYQGHVMTPFADLTNNKSLDIFARALIREEISARPSAFNSNSLLYTGYGMSFDEMLSATRYGQICTVMCATEICSCN